VSQLNLRFIATLLQKDRPLIFILVKSNAMLYICVAIKRTFSCNTSSPPFPDFQHDYKPWHPVSSGKLPGKAWIKI
jgi:hypothetical protein